MTIDRKAVFREVRDIILFALVSVAMTFVVCPRCQGFQDYAWSWFFTWLIWIFLWKGNSLLANYITSKIPWIDFPLKRLSVGMVATISYSVGAVVLLMTFFEVVFNIHFGKAYIYTIYGSLGVTIFMAMILHSRSFFLHWQQAALDAAKYEKESIAMRYESLKNQVNPHFLFNSFNALTNLVYEDQNKAVKFIKQLSEVYRYVLDTRDRELVTLREEMKFLDSYIYLQKIRFEHKLNIDVNLPEGDIRVAPLALQMLIENAIKHNIVSEDDPLTIKLYQEDGYIVVENNIQRKTFSSEPSAGVGLENICRRYEFLSHKKVIIDWNESRFVVKLPELTEHA